MDYTFTIAFLVGVASTLHCATMCSGIMGALTYSLPGNIRQNQRQFIPFLLAYNTGRIISYGMAGAIVGWISSVLFNKIDPQFAHYLFHTVTMGIAFVVSLYLMGVFPKLLVIEHIGKPIWRRIEPVGRKLLPVQHVTQALMFGAIWGWLPCGLVYSILTWAAVSGDASHGAMVMLAFGLGTIPTLMVTGFFSSWIFRITKNKKNLGRALGSVIISVSILFLFIHEHAQGVHH